MRAADENITELFRAEEEENVNHVQYLVKPLEIARGDTWETLGSLITMGASSCAGTIGKLGNEFMLQGRPWSTYLFTS